MSSAVGFTDRNALLQSMTAGEQQSWDVIIVGGGITGAGVLREAVRMGYRALLVEQRDFSWGTSSRSSKMIHGGLRYLGSGDYKLTMHSLTERERLVEEAPGLVDRMDFYFGLRKGVFPG
ncbi:MAG: FAD-dependent oxidoreductase, partial [Pseudomonadales bacterium]